MTTATSTRPVEPKPLKLTVDQFDDMREVGIWSENGHVELLDGKLYLGGEPLRLTAAQVERLCEAGVFDEDERIELLDGELYAMPPIGDWHNAGVDALGRSLAARRRDDPIVRSGGSVRIGTWTEPQPDVAVLRFRSDLYRNGGARAEDVLLLVEVSDSSETRDKLVKLPLYAAAGIPEVWIVTREAAAIEAYRRPLNGGYAEKHTYSRGETVTTPALPDVRVAVSEITG